MNIKKYKEILFSMKHLCKYCYKRFNNPNFMLFHNQILQKLIQKIMKKIIKFGGVGLSKKCNIYFIRNTFNLTYKYLFKFCYFELAEPKNYIKLKSGFNNIPSYEILGMIVSIQNKIGRKYVKLLPIYKIKEYLEYNYL